MSSNRDNILNLLCVSLQRNILNVEDLKGFLTPVVLRVSLTGVAAMFLERNVDKLVRSSALDLIVHGLRVGIFSVEDLKTASQLVEAVPGGPGYGGGMRASPEEQNTQFREGDWICEVCGNLNFARRTECHKDSCKAPRPSPRPSRGGQFNQRSSDMGPGALPQGSNADARPGDWNCLKCGNLNFAFRTECNRSTCKEPRSSRDEGSMNRGGSIGAGGYGQARDGDWNCAKCGYMNFARRTECNQCNAPRSGPAKGGLQSRTGGNQRRGGPTNGGYGQARAGDWVCDKCNYMNFARRTECNECKAPRSDVVEGSSGGGLYDPYRN